MLYFSRDPLFVLWFLHIATFSMLPLLDLDRLIFPSVILTIIYLLSVRISIRWSSDEKTSTPQWDVLSLSSINDNKLFIGIFYLSTFVACSSLLVAQVFVRPPESLPFLFPLLISAYSCAHFVLFFVYFNFRQIFGGAIDIAKRVNSKTIIHKSNAANKKKKH